MVLLHCVFFPHLKDITLEALPLFLMGSSLDSEVSVLELAGTGSPGHRETFWQLLTEAMPVAPCSHKPNRVIESAGYLTSRNGHVRAELYRLNYKDLT